jgi:GNAT superfamily N-acetyltransferase
MIPKITNKEACELALKHRLYVSRWNLHHELSIGAKYDRVKQAAVWVENGIPLGVAVITMFGDVQAFVRKSRRREGIGSKLIDEMKRREGKDASKMDAGIGLKKGSEDFWRANNIKMY